MKFENQISNLDTNLYDKAWQWCLLNKCNSFAYEKEFRIAYHKEKKNKRRARYESIKKRNDE